MKQHLFNLSLAAILSFGLSACSSNSERHAKMATNGPKHTHAGDEQWYASCSTAGGHPVPWTGPVRTSREWAIRDAGQHDKDYPGHHAGIAH
jgi:hypothetical protein